nr:tripartite tricarboxylate transporter substrate binding protein [Pseudomonas sp.]
KNLPYDIYTDFRPLSVLAYSSNLWLVPDASPLKTLDDLVALAKREPGKVSYGSYGAGSSSHLHAERFKRQMGIEMVHVPYKGAAPLVTDVLGGHVTVGLADVTTSAAHVKAGKARVLAVDGASRVAIAPDAPQMKELGYEGFESNGWFGFLAPAKTPEPVVQKLSTEINRIVRLPEMAAALEGLSLRAGGTTPDETAEIMKREGQAWEAMVRDINLTLD